MDRIYPYCPILNRHPLLTKDGKLFVNETLIKSCTSERKADISSSYGEGLGMLLLRNYVNVKPFGVLKIETGEAKTPDFIVVNREKQVTLLAEIKSTINSYPASPTEQLSAHKRTYNCLGVQVKFNKGETPVDIILSDPEYKLTGNIFPTIYSNITILNAIHENENNDKYINSKEDSKILINEFMEIMKDYDFSNLDLTNIIENNIIHTGIEKIDKFLKNYLSSNEDILLKPKKEL